MHGSSHSGNGQGFGVANGLGIGLAGLFSSMGHPTYGPSSTEFGSGKDAIGLIGYSQNVAGSVDLTKFTQSDVDALRRVDYTQNDNFGVRINPHTAELDLKAVVERAIGGTLASVPAIRVGGSAFDRTVHGTLPVDAFLTIAPLILPDVRDGTGNTTRVWRNYFQTGRKEMPWSAREYDNSIPVYLEVSGMTWFEKATGLYRSQFIVRVLGDNLNRNARAHRKVAHAMVVSVGERAMAYRPRVVPQVTSATEQAPAPAAAGNTATVQPGVDLRSALATSNSPKAVQVVVVRVSSSRRRA